MKKVIVKNKQGIQTHGAEMEDPTQWIAHCVANNFWGKPERWVKEGSEEYHPEDILDTRVVELSPSIPEQLDENGVVVQEAIPAISETQVQLKADYTVEIVDVTYEHALKECLSNRKLEYPTAEDFLNVFFDGTDIDLELLKAQRLAIKAKYPKP